MDRPLKSEPKSCLVKQNREFSDDEVNQEVPQNFVTKLTSIQRPVRQKEPSWQIPLTPPPRLPTAKASEEFNWQANQPTIRERNAVMFNNPLMADAFFKVGTAPNVQRIPAHKYILATGSSVFFAMFYGGLANHEGDIEIPDVEPGAFLNLLRYMYNVLLLINKSLFSTMNCMKVLLMFTLLYTCMSNSLKLTCQYT